MDLQITEVTDESLDKRLMHAVLVASVVSASEHPLSRAEQGDKQVQIDGQWVLDGDEGLLSSSFLTRWL